MNIWMFRIAFVVSLLLLICTEAERKKKKKNWFPIPVRLFLHSTEEINNNYIQTTFVDCTRYTLVICSCFVRSTLGSDPRMTDWGRNHVMDFYNNNDGFANKMKSTALLKENFNLIHRKSRFLLASESSIQSIAAVFSQIKHSKRLSNFALSSVGFVFSAFHVSIV